MPYPSAPRRLLETLFLCCLLISNAYADEWSLGTHKPITGDFNGDGIADLLLQSRDANNLNAIAFGLGNGNFGIAQQRWDADYLGLGWLTSNLYIGDFNGDGRSDILLQNQSSGTHRILLASASGTFDSVSFNISDAALGLSWSGSASKLIVADFTGDGRDDVLLQPQHSNGAVSIVTAGSSGNLDQVLQSWAANAYGLNWTTSLVSL